MFQRNGFDEIARVLAMPIPRRKIFRFIAVEVAAAAMVLLWPHRAQAANCTCQTITDCLVTGSLCNSSAPCDAKVADRNTSTCKVMVAGVLKTGVCRSVCRSAANNALCCCDCVFK